MNGIEKITQRIDAAAESEVNAILSEAKEKAIAIAKSYQAEADRKTADSKAKAEKAAVEREERLVSVAQMQARQIVLGAKQEVVGKAFDMALERLKKANVPDCETQLRLRRPEISVELAKLLFPEA